MANRKNSKRKKPPQQKSNSTGLPSGKGPGTFDSRAVQEISTNNFKLKTIIDEFLKKRKVSEVWLGIFIALIISLFTSDFHDIDISDTILIKASDVRTMYFILMVFSFIMFIICKFISRKYTSKYLVEKIRDKGASLD